MVTTMRAMAMTTQGNVADLRCMDVPMPEPGRGEVRVKVHASAVNSADYKVATGAGGFRFIHAKAFPLRVGYDVSGVVDATGEGATALAAGDAVFGHLAYLPVTRQGAFAEYVTLPEAALARKPPGLSHETAAAAATAGGTALLALRDEGRLVRGGRVLVIGAAGGVGSLAVGVGKQLGAHVTAICSAATLDFVRGLGADEVVDRKAQDLTSLPGGYDVVFDTPVAHSYLECRPLLSPTGAYVTTLLTFGVVAGSVASAFSSRRSRLVVVKSRRADLEEVARFVGKGMSVPIDSRFPVREAASAIERLHRGGMRGRIVIDVASGW